jgi:hypothetical protein
MVAELEHTTDFLLRVTEVPFLKHCNLEKVVWRKKKQRGQGKVVPVLNPPTKPQRCILCLTKHHTMKTWMYSSTHSYLWY